ncbi:hypothetical protein CHUAL_001258 [Chamberlinius hualienensis]
MFVSKATKVIQEIRSQNKSYNLKKSPTNYRPFIMLLKLFGSNLDRSPAPRSSRCKKWVIRVVTFLMASVNAVCCINSLCNGFDSGDLWILCFAEFVFVLTFLYVLSTREKEIQNFIVNLLETAKGVDTSQIDHMCKCHVGTALFLVFSYSPVCTYYQIMVAIKCEKIFQLNYFGHSTSSSVRVMVTVISELSYNLTCLTAQLYAIFIILTIRMLALCYENANNNFKSLKATSVEITNKYQEKHQKLHKMTDQFNRLFSPAVLVLILFHIGSIIGTPGNVRAQVMWNQLFAYPALLPTVVTWFGSIFPVIRAAFITITLLNVTHNLHQQVNTILND